MKPLFELTNRDNLTYWSTRAKRLVHCKKYAEVENLLLRLPNSPEYQENEEIIRAKIALAWHRKDIQAVYKLIEVVGPWLFTFSLWCGTLRFFFVSCSSCKLLVSRSNFCLEFVHIQEGTFSQGDDLIEIWDEAHVYEAKARTAVQRFRVRQRFVWQFSLLVSACWRHLVIKLKCDLHGKSSSSKEKAIMILEFDLFEIYSKRFWKVTDGGFSHLIGFFIFSIYI